MATHESDPVRDVGRKCVDVGLREFPLLGLRSGELGQNGFHAELREGKVALHTLELVQELLVPAEQVLVDSRAVGPDLRRDCDVGRADSEQSIGGFFP